MKLLPLVIKGICAGVLVTSAFVLTARGNMYTGTITQTITSTNDSSFYLGEIFTSTYQYESDGIDGIFGVPDRYHDSAVNTLQGTLYNWDPHAANGVVEQSMSVLGSFLTVCNGCVTDFNFDGERSFGQFWFSGCSFTWDGYFPFQSGISTTGTIKFSSPSATSVPDGGTNSALLVLFGLMALNFYRRR